MTKLKVFFSPNIDEEIRDSLCSILGFKSTPNLGKYLGFPVQYKNSSSRDFDFILERVQNKLQDWKANLLSMAGKLILTKTMISVIPSYLMQGCILPGRIHSNFDKISRNFLWGFTEEKKKLHMIGWIKLLSWKIEGGWAYMLPRRETPHWQQNYAGEWGEKVVSFGPMSWNTNIVGGQFLTRLLNPDLGRQCFIAQLCVNWVWNGPLVVTINYPFRITNG